MSYGQKPAAWARPPIIGGNQNQQLNQSLFANQLGLAGQAFGAMPAMSLGSSLNALVNQAAFSNMNSVLAQAQAAQRLLPQNVPAQPSQRQAQSPTPSRNQRTFVGTVTKLMETYGFVDEDVFFQTNVIRGPMPRVGDRVMVEASFNPSMPFKWNAYRIQLTQQPDAGSAQGHHQNYSRNTVPQSHVANNNRWAGDRRDENLRNLNNVDRSHRTANRRSPASNRNEARRSPLYRSPIRKSPVRKTSPVVRLKENLKREREKSPIRENREAARTRSPALSIAASVRHDADSPPRRRQRIIPRYRCYKPKTLVQNGELKYLDLHKRYSNLYIPSDFIRCEMSWLKSVQLDSIMQFSPYPVNFTILHKDVDVPLEDNDFIQPENPPDADHRYFVKIMLLSHPGISTLRQKVYGLLPDGTIDETAEKQNFFKTLNFVVGVKNKSDYMCIGGAWSPSLDGENPFDPQTLINTAVRTTKTLVGLDLSTCARWYKMVHLHYYRTERNRVDSVVLMLPDTSSAACLMPPSAEAFQQLEEKIKFQLSQKIAAIDAEQFVPETAKPIINTSGDFTVNASEQLKENLNKLNGTSESNEFKQINNNEINNASSKIPAVSDTVTNAQNVPQSDSTIDASSEEICETKDGNLLQRNLLTAQKIKTLKVAELREELETRGLDSKGVKNVLLQRLKEALVKEGVLVDAEANDVAETFESEVPVAVKEEIMEQMEVDDQKKTDEEKKSNVEKEKLEKEQKLLEKAKEKFEKSKTDRKIALERHYTLPKEPTIFLYPNKTAKNGKFECKIVSMDTLLSYCIDDNKESAFEAFLFAEAVREAFDRLSAFTVYQNLDAALDREAERVRRDTALVDVKEKENLDEVVVVDNKTEKKVEKNEKKLDSRHKFKALINNFEAFIAFAHFDENLCGYIEDRDVEEIIYSIGIDVSRSEVQKIIKKCSIRERVYYRDYTDKWVDIDGNVKYFSTPSTDARGILELASGHLCKEVKKTLEPAIGTTPDVTETGIIFYKGTVLNVAQALEQHSIVDKERTAAILKNEELNMQLKSTKKQRDQFEKMKRRLEEDFDRYKKKLYEAEKCLKASQEGSIAYKETLQDCKKYAQRIFGIVDKVMPPPKKKDVKKEGRKSAEKNSEVKEKSENPQNAGENTDAIINDEIVLTEEVGGNEDGLDEIELSEVADDTENQITNTDCNAENFEENV